MKIIEYDRAFRRSCGGIKILLAVNASVDNEARRWYSRAEWVALVNSPGALHRFAA